MLLILILALSWNVQQGTALLGVSQSALQEPQMITTGSFNPIPPSNQTCNAPTTSDESGNFSAVSRLSPLYRSQPLRLYQYIEGFMSVHPLAKVLVILPGQVVHSVRARDFLYGMPNVYVSDLPMTFDGFQQLVRDSTYSLVLVYSEYFSGYYATASHLPKYFPNVMCNETPIKVIPIWIWYEGYLYQLS
jgi:hypothetical protein